MKVFLLCDKIPGLYVCACVFFVIRRMKTALLASAAKDFLFCYMPKCSSTSTRLEYVIAHITKL